MAKFIRNLKDILEVCDIRSSAGLNCKDCRYYGKSCTSVKNEFNVQKPYMYIDILEFKKSNKSQEVK